MQNVSKRVLHLAYWLTSDLLTFDFHTCVQNISSKLISLHLPVCVCVCSHVCVYTHTYTMHTHTCTHTHSTLAHAYHIHISVCMYTSMFICTYVHTHTHTHTHTCVCARVRSTCARVCLLYDVIERYAYTTHARAVSVCSMTYAHIPTSLFYTWNIRMYKYHTHAHNHMYAYIYMDIDKMHS